MDSESQQFTKLERRSEKRDRVTANVSIMGEDERGRETVFKAKLLDLSVHGAQFHTLWKLPVHSPVVFYNLKFGVGGRGTVRYCNPSNRGYEIGVEFLQGTGWCGAMTPEELMDLAPITTIPASQSK